MNLFEIKSWLSGRVLFSIECGSMKICCEAAVKAGAVLTAADLRGAYLMGADLTAAYLMGADLTGADLMGADLTGADLTSAVLTGADLRGAYLTGADLTSAVLTGAEFDIPAANNEQSTENLDKVREIILHDPTKLYMDHWHGGNEWKDRTCAIEAACGTTHCLAGWLQVCSTDKKLRTINTQLAGTLCAPVAAKMFFKGNTEVTEWLENRRYVTELSAS